MKEKLDQLRHKIDIRRDSRYDEQMLELLDILIAGIPAGAPAPADEAVEVLRCHIRGAVIDIQDELKEKLYNPDKIEEILTDYAKAILAALNQPPAQTDEAVERLKHLLVRAEGIIGRATVANEDEVAACVVRKEIAALNQQKP